MLVWGDQVRVEDPREKLACLEKALHEVADAPVGIERHALLVAALVEAGELVQGLADVLLLAAGHDARSAVEMPLRWPS